MIKVFALLRRREGWTREQFHRWWIEEHVPYAKKLPGLRKYRVCLVKGSTTHPGHEPWDGIAELLGSTAARLSTRRGRPTSGWQRWSTPGQATPTA